MGEWRYSATSASDTGELSASRPGAFTSGKILIYFYTGLCTILTYYDLMQFIKNQIYNVK